MQKTVKITNKPEKTIKNESFYSDYNISKSSTFSDDETSNAEGCW